MRRNNDLLKFILKKKMPLWKAIEILEEAEKQEREKHEKCRPKYDIAVLDGYEKR